MMREDYETRKQNQGKTKTKRNCTVYIWALSSTTVIRWRCRIGREMIVTSWCLICECIWRAIGWVSSIVVLIRWWTSGGRSLWTLRLIETPAGVRILRRIGICSTELRLTLRWTHCCIAWITWWTTRRCSSLTIGITLRRTDLPRSIWARCWRRTIGTVWARIGCKKRRFLFDWKRTREELISLP